MIEREFPRDSYETRECPVCHHHMIACWIHNRALEDGTQIWHWWCGACGNTEGEYLVKPEVEDLLAHDRERFKRLNPPTHYRFSVNDGNVITSSGKILPPPDEIEVTLTRKDATELIELLKNALANDQTSLIHVKWSGDLIKNNESEDSYAVLD